MDAASPAQLAKRGFSRQEWAKLRDRNEALDCAVLARAALWLLGADRYGDRFWQRLRTEVADAPLLAPPVAADSGATAVTDTPAADTSHVRPRSWLAPRGGWLR